VRVVVGEDDALYREGLVRLLTEAGYEVVGQARDAPELERKVAGHRPELVVTDVRMPPDGTDDGLRAAIAIRRRFPDIAVLVLSQYVAQRPAAELIGERADGVGYLLKDRVTDLDQFVDAVARVASGGTALDPEIVSRLLGRRRAGPLDELTPRERDVLREMAEGKNNAAIAATLVLAERSVEKVIHAVFLKLGLGWETAVHKRVKAVLLYLAETPP
jgi:DNA-binding NarL/FixJ family response regulator